MRYGMKRQNHKAMGSESTNQVGEVAQISRSYSTVAEKQVTFVQSVIEHLVSTVPLILTACDNSLLKADAVTGLYI